MNRTTKQQAHEQTTKLTKTCQFFGSKPGCMSAYIETVCWPRIEAIEVAPKIHAKQFHHPAKKPHGRPYFPAVTEAQWYTPLAEGIPDASSARDAETSQ